MAFVCRGCINPITITGCTSVNSGVNANLELADKFCYLADMMIVDGDIDAVVETRIRIGWNRFEQKGSSSKCVIFVPPLVWRVFACH